MTDLEDLDARRRGYWLRRARENAGVTLADAAMTAGLAGSSGSTVSLWEKGTRAIKVVQMKRLAVRYGVPVGLFTDPPVTDDERLADAIAAAQGLEREDWDAAPEGRRPAGGAPDAERHRRLA